MRPGPGSKRSPTPWVTSSSTRAFGIFTTNSLRGVIIAKILPFAFSAPEPKPCRDSRVTPRLPAKAATTGANCGLSAAFSRFEDSAAAFLCRFDMARRHIVTLLVLVLVSPPHGRAVPRTAPDRDPQGRRADARTPSALRNPPQ